MSTAPISPDDLKRAQRLAYISILRAAQLSPPDWETEATLAQLRRHLRIPDGLHEEVANKVQSDNKLQELRRAVQQHRQSPAANPGNPGHTTPSPSPGTSSGPAPRGSVSRPTGLSRSIASLAGQTTTGTLITRAVNGSTGGSSSQAVRNAPSSSAALASSAHPANAPRTGTSQGRGRSGVGISTSTTPSPRSGAVGGAADGGDGIGMVHAAKRTGRKNAGKTKLARNIEEACPQEFIDGDKLHALDVNLQGLVIERFWEKDGGWCTGIVAQSVTRRDTRVHHIVYDVNDPNEKTTWELGFAFSWGQANERWRIPKPARYEALDWANIVPPDPRKGGKSKRSGSTAVGGSSSKARRIEHADGGGPGAVARSAPTAAVAAGDEDAARPPPPPVDPAAVVEAKRRGEAGDAAAVENILADIDARRGHIVDLLAQNQLSAGLELHGNDRAALSGDLHSRLALCRNIIRDVERNLAAFEVDHTPLSQSRGL